MLYFDPKFAVNHSGRHHTAQANYVEAQRAGFDAENERLVKMNALASGFQGNAAAIIPQDVYREFDNQTVELVRANNLALLNDLLPLAKSLPVGKVEHVTRQVSDSGLVTSSLGGQVPAELDKADYNYKSHIKVIHQTGFGREWMELEGQRSEGFDALIDDQANATRAVLDKTADHIYNGVDIDFKGISAVGIKNSSDVAAVNLGAAGLNIDFTSESATAADIRNAWRQMRDVLTITNNVSQDITFYISAEIATNFERYYGVDAGDSGKTLLQTLRELEFVGDIKTDRSLSGNEVVGVVLSTQYIQPLVGMAITTVPIIRSKPFENYNFVTWNNVGLEFRPDYTGKTGVLYARVI